MIEAQVLKMPKHFGTYRPNNCDFETSLEKRCPHCKQNHLRPGYCQALDPKNAEQYPEVWAKPVTDSRVTDEAVTDVVTDKICVICGDPFQAKRASAITCSDVCRTRKRRAEKANA